LGKMGGLGNLGGLGGLGGVLRQVIRYNARKCSQRKEK